MVRHIVCWKLKDGLDKTSTVEQMRSKLTALVGKIGGLKSAEVGECYQGGWDACLCTVFESREALKLYRTHPAHVKVQEFVHSVICERTSADYDI